MDPCNRVARFRNCSNPRAIAEPSPGRHRATRAAEGDEARGPAGREAGAGAGADYYPQENPQPSRDPQQQQNGGGESRLYEPRHPLGSAASGSAGITLMYRSERARAREACASGGQR